MLNTGECAIHSERKVFAAKVNVPQEKPQTLSHCQRMRHDKRFSYVPHDFPPCQAYLIFHGMGNKSSGEKHRWYSLPRPPGSRSSHRIRWLRTSIHNTDRNLSFSVVKSMKIDTHPHVGTGDVGAHRSGNITHENEKKEGNSHSIANIDNLLQFGGRHRKRVRERSWGCNRPGQLLILRETPESRALAPN